jgi:hypothetical protein
MIFPFALMALPEASPGRIWHSLPVLAGNESDDNTSHQGGWSPPGFANPSGRRSWIFREAGQNYSLDRGA